MEKSIASNIPKSAEQICIDLKDRLTGEIYCDLINRTLYATDASMFKVVPRAVVEPKSIQDIRHVVQYARQHKIPLAPRGGGTGLAGESLTSGIVIDFSVHMNQIIQVNESESWVKVQAGVVWGQLNQLLKTYGKLFGPDPATGDRCTLGGMIANNSTGAHSLRYKMTSNWVKSLTVMLDDGTVCEFEKKEIDSPEFIKLLKTDTREAQIYKKCLPLLDQNRDLINEKWPSTPRNRHGYLLKYARGESPKTIDLAQVLCASEGTLGLVLSAKLGVSDIPKYKSLIWPGFSNRRLAAQATASILKYDPAAIEIIDEICLDMAREDSTYQDIFGPEVKSILLVEFDGQTQEEIDKKIDDVEAEIVGEGKLANSLGRCENELMRESVWQMRKLIAGMINRVPGNFKPVPVIEDVCVRPELLPKYLDGVDKILSKRGLKFLCYGHAGDGTAHIRPFIDLKSGQTYEWLPQMCGEIYDLTMELNGTISAEHGDGYLRAPFIAKQYGDLFEVFIQIKKIFDPELIFNPDKKTGCQDFSNWKENLRYGASYKPQNLESKLIWKGNGKELIDLIEACNGCGACRSTLLERDMCPMYRSIGKEAASTRAKANLMRSYINGEFDEIPMKELMKVSDLCINCKRCADDCPAKVKASDLMLELRARAVEKEGMAFKIKLLTMMESFLKLGSLIPRISNFFSDLTLVRKVLEFVVGIDSKRSLPKLKNRSFQNSFKISFGKEERGIESSGFNSGTKVAYFVDTFSDLLESRVADCLIKILKHNEIEVVIPKQVGSGVVTFIYGDVKGAKRIAKKNVQNLIQYVRSGYQIICSEPTAALMLKDEYLFLDNSQEFQEVASNTTEAMEFLLNLHNLGKLKTDFNSLPASFKSFGYHRPCHAKSLEKDSSSLKLLKLIPGIDVHDLDCGCCGIAGTFGMRTKGFQKSMEIGSRLFEKIENSEYKQCLTECSTCKIQIEQGASGVSVYHPLEILAIAYGLNLEHVPKDFQN